MESVNLAEIMRHFKELRKRVMWSAISVIIATLLSFLYIDKIIDILKIPAGNVQFIFIEVTEAFSTYMKLGVLIGLLVAMPFIIYQILMFIVPALRPSETKMVLFAIPFVVVMFYGGILFCYFLILPPAMHFLMNFGSSEATIQPRLSLYLDVVTRLMLVVGLVFELPVITSFLSFIGIISYKWLTQKRKWWILAAFIIAAVITPTPDMVNQSIVAGILIILYEFGVVLSWLIGKRNKQEVGLANE
jgi:sec-independent protein translocase protein TatC